MQRTEIPNNTDEQVWEYVSKALNLVHELDPAPDLRASVLEQACALYAGKQILVAQPQALPSPIPGHWNGLR
jgi:hypothetical protein